MTFRKHKTNLMTYFGCLVLASYIIGGNVLTINFGRRLPLKLAEILSIVFIAFYIIKHHIIILKKHEKYVLIWLAEATLAACFTTVIHKHIGFGDLIYGVSYSVRILLVLFTANILQKCFKEGGLDKSIIINYILNLYLIVCLIGFFQLVFFPVAFDFYDVFYKLGFYIANPDPHINRLISTYLDPNYLSACLVIPFAIAFNQWKNGEKIKLVYVIIYAFTVVLTVSRSGVLGICLVIMISMLKWRYTSKDIVFDMIIILAVVAITIFMFSNNIRVIDRILNSSSDDSTYSRITSWHENVEIIKDNWLFGLGYNMIGAYRLNVMGSSISISTGYGSYSSLLLILTCSGIVGVIYCAYALGKILSDKLYFKFKNEKTILIQILLTTLVITNFNNVLFYVLWILPMAFLINIYADS